MEKLKSAKISAIFNENFKIRDRCKGVHCVDLGESFSTSIYLQNLASIQPRTSLVKFARSPHTVPPGLQYTERCANAQSKFDFLSAVGREGPRRHVRHVGRQFPAGSRLAFPVMWSATVLLALAHGFSPACGPRRYRASSQAVEKSCLYRTKFNKL